MQRYESYKPSGAAWLGNVPFHWDVQPLRAVTSLKSDKNRPDLPVLSVYREYGVILKDSRDDNHNATSLDTSTYKVVKPGDLVVNKMKAWQGSMGVSAHEGIVSPAYITCTTRADRVRPAYLHYLLRSSPLIGVYNSLSYGVRVGQWDMHYEDFKQIQIPLPTKDEQDRIVAFLDQKTAEIDAAIAKKEQLIQLLHEQKSSLINNALTRGLKAGENLRSSGVSWIGDIPEDWSVSKLNRIAFYQEGPGLRTWQFTESGTKVICVTNICPPEISFEKMTKYISTAEYKRRYKHFTVQKGDILLASSGASWGKVAEYKAEEELILNTSTIRINSLRSGGVTKDFIKSVLQARYVADQLAGLLTGSCQPNFGPTHLNKLMCTHPKSKVEQDEISTYVEEIAVRTQKAVESILETVSALQEMKSAVCAAVVCGKLKV